MRAILSVLALFLVGCGANQAYVKEASSVMGNNQTCMRLIQSNDFLGFNHMAGVVIRGKASISVATDGKTSVCGLATNAPNDVVESKLTDGYGVTWEKIDQVSLARCERMKELSAPNLRKPCRVFSHNYEIVYKKDAEDAR